MTNLPLRLRNCNFKFKCTQSWELLEITDEEGVRFCKDCQKDVHMVGTLSDLYKSLKNDFCVAIPFDPSEEPWDERANHLIGMVTSISSD